jgi:lipopolysaccharide export system protein LptA
MPTRFRKLKILLVTFISLLLIYFVYTNIFKTPEIDIQGQREKAEDIEVPDFRDSSTQAGEFSVDQVESARYTMLDENKKVKQVFGFSKLLSKEKGSNRWEILDPSMVIYEQDNLYRITADKGTVVMEMVAGQPSPTDAQLKDDVVIEIIPLEDGAGGGDKQCDAVATILLDDLDYVSEQSEFSTKKSVRLISDDASMEGRGMLLIYNQGLDRLELLRIDTVDFIRLSNVKDVDSFSGQDSSEEADSAHPGVVADAQRGVQVGVDQNGKGDTLYQCHINEDVLIEYGGELLVSGSDRVTINNILWSSSDAQDDLSGDSQGGGERAPGSDDGLTETVNGDETADEATQEISDRVDVYVTCKGSLVVKPMVSFVESGNKGISFKGGNKCQVEMVGAPINIKQKQIKGSDSATTIARCGKLKYDFATEVLDMFTNVAQPSVSLNSAASDAVLHTSGAVSYRKRDGKAVVTGPGRILSVPYMVNSAGEQEEDYTELSFKGSMELFFAPYDMDLATNMEVLSMNFTGGMDAMFHSANPGTLSADNAKLYFANGRKLKNADLRGNVIFASASDEGVSSAQANQADLFFADRNRIEKANLKGNVHFLAENFDSPSSSAIARQARLLFDADNQIRLADMAGDVKFLSEQKVLSSQRAQIQFAKNEQSGKREPAFFIGTSRPVIESGGGEDTRTKLLAERIDYDILTSNAFAHGPVSFTFYVGDEDGGDDKLVPIVITADDNARYFSSQNRVVFNGDVVGTRSMQSEEFLQESRFFGDQLSVDLDSRRDIKHVTISGGEVKLETVRYAGQDVISHTRLRCEQIDYEASGEMVEAAGPGIIEIDNSKIAPPNEVSGQRFSIKRPCYAVIDGFDKLKWFTGRGYIDAMGKDKSINIGYMPIVDGRQGKVVNASATKVMANYVQLPGGRSELTELTAADGVWYKEEDGHEFRGDYLHYNPQSSVLTVNGLPGHPCLLDGSLADKIVYNLESGEVKASMPRTPGVLPKN